MLMINVTNRIENNERFSLYCLPLNSDWSFNSLFYIQNGEPSEISYEGLLKNIPTANKVSINMRNEWVAIEYNNLIQDWVSQKKPNNGVAFFTDSNSEIVFEGFDSIRKSLTPKLVITFGSPAKPQEIAKSEEIKIPSDPKVLAKNSDSLLGKEPVSNEIKTKENIVDTAKKEKDLKGDDENQLYKNFDKKEEGEKPPTEITEKKKSSNIFEDDPTEKKAKEETAVAVNENKTKAVNGSVTKTLEKSDSIQLEVAVDITMKEPSIFPAARLLEVTDLVKFENPESKGELRYTLDGKDPSPDSFLYEEPIKLTGNHLHTVKAAIFLDRIRKSPIKIQEFRISNSLGQIIDNTSSNCKKIGNWQSSMTKPNYYGKDYLWEQKGKGTVEWVPSISKKCNYEVYIWIPDGDGVTRSNKTKYVIKYDGGSKDIFVDQTVRGSKWIYLGEYSMKSGAGSVTMYDDGSGKMYVADASYFYIIPDTISTGN